VHSEIKPSNQPKPSFIETARRAQIIECAIDAIAELGFAQASLAQIAKRAGVSTGVILYYFAGKDELIREVIAHVYATGRALIEPRVNDEATARAALRCFIEASVGFVASRPNYTGAVMNIIRAGRTDAGAPRVDPVVDQPRHVGFRSILEWGQGGGEFRPFAVGVMVETIVEALDAIPPQLAADPGLDLDAYARELVELFDRATRADTPAQGSIR
jgi:TetR/AcrR family transcriptional regulator, fatty acid metabolism regulator protein